MEKIHDKLSTVEVVREVIIKIINMQRVVPFVSGILSISFLDRAINANLQGSNYYVAIGAGIIIFLASILAYCYLSKIEKDKDTEIVDVVKRIVEAVYKHFGVAMANKDASATAAVMNPLMQTIVNLVKEFKKLAEKGYKN